MRLLSLLTALLLPAITRAEVYFHEDFEPGDAYSVNGSVPFDYGVIRHGRWQNLGKSYQTGVVVAENEGHAVKLSHGRDKKGARMIGSFGVDNQDSVRVETPLRIRLSFKYSGPLDDTFLILIYGGDGKSRATIGAGADGHLFASFGGEREELGGEIKPDQWYLLEFLLPGNPRNSSRWTANLYENNGEAIVDSRQGAIARSIEEGGANYSAIDIQIRNPDTVLYIDNIKVETHEAP